MNKPNSNISIACGGLVLAAAAAIAGCNQRQGHDGLPAVPEICADPCNVDIELPNDLGKRPEAPAETVVDAGSTVNFRLPQKNPQTDDERTVLSFEEPAFVDGSGKKLFTLELTGGNNSFIASKGVCKAHQDPAKNGCRYVVINVGSPGRASVISSPRFVIR